MIFIIMNQLIKKLLRENLYKRGDDDLARTLYSLIKYNGGYFKSDKQRDFLFKKSIGPDENGFYEIVLNRSIETIDYETDGGGFHQHTVGRYKVIFILDSLGIIKQEKELKRGTITQWERSDLSMDISKKNIEKRALIKAFNNLVNFANYGLDDLKNKYNINRNSSDEQVNGLINGKYSEQDLIDIITYCKSHDNIPLYGEILEKTEKLLLFYQEFKTIKNKYLRAKELVDKSKNSINDLTPEEQQEVLNFKI